MDGSQVQAHARLSDTETPEALALTDEIRRTVNEAIESAAGRPPALRSCCESSKA
jgi:hypothetical protein